jgi:hypothetical protein
MKKPIVIVGSVFVLGAVAYGAMVFGYLLGGSNYAARFAPIDAVLTVSVLERLRAGEIDAATDLLESRLDTHIVEHSTFQPEIARWLDPFTSADSNASIKLMARVAKYRSEHPSVAIPPEVRERIENHLRLLSP